MPAKLIGVGLGTLVVFVTGVVLTRGARPYSGALVNLHKLIDLAAVAFVGMAVYQAQRSSGLSGAAWPVIAATAAFVVATFATGGVVSAMHEPPAWVLWLHRVGSWVAGALLIASAYVAYS